MKTDVLLDLYADSMRSLDEVMTDVPADRTVDQPHGVVNHPAWTLTHLCVTTDLVLQVLGKPTLCPSEWSVVALTDTHPKPDASIYPTAQAALEMLHRQHDQIDPAIRQADPALFDQPAPEALRALAPTIGHIMTYMLTAHEQYHLAQLHTWKRSAGLKA